jgi:hypothetical protein
MLHTDEYTFDSHIAVRLYVNSCSSCSHVARTARSRQYFYSVNLVLLFVHLLHQIATVSVAFCVLFSVVQKHALKHTRRSTRLLSRVGAA